MLKVKLKSLAAEARIIRKEELRARSNDLREELYLHRIGPVREAARNTHLAYGFIRGRTIDEMEPTRKSEPDWKAIQKMLDKYGNNSMKYELPMAA